MAKSGKMKIVQVNSSLIKKDSICNIILASHNVFASDGLDSKIVVDTISEYNDDFIYPLFLRESIRISPFKILEKVLFFENKMRLLKGYAKSMQHYKKAMAIFDNADVRIWHNSGFLLSDYLIRKHDIFFFHNYTFPYLRDKFNGPNELTLRVRLQAYNDLDLTYICPSQFNINSLDKLNINYKNVYKLPLYHKYNLPYIGRQAGTPKLIAWGRYAKNKAVPELVKMASEANLNFTYFGDNYTLKEHKTEYEKAKEYLSNKISLQGQIDDFEGELSKANIYICNSYFEGFNMPLIEAEAHSLPVLARRGTAMDELVKDGYNGFLFSDINEVPELIGKIMRDYKRFSFNAWKHSQNFTYKKFKERYLSILNKYNKARR